MVELLGAYSVEQILIILIIGITSVVGVITGAKKLWKQRENFKNSMRQEGRASEAQEEHAEARLTSMEKNISELQTNNAQLQSLLEDQQRLIELLIASDELNIKAWIKEQHDIWVPRGCIDSQVLEVLEQRFAIYAEEGGNSWAKKLMDELRALPTIISIKDEE